MHYLCQECQNSFSSDELFTIAKQVGGQTKLLRVCVDCKEKHEKDLELSRQNFQAQFGEKAVLHIDDGGKATITPVIDIHKIIDDAMEKKDRSVMLYIGENGTSVYVNPYKDDKVVWKAAPGAKHPYCSNCGRQAEAAYSFCPWCGEQVAISEEDAMAMSEKEAKRRKRLHDVMSTMMTKEEE